MEGIVLFGTILTLIGVVIYQGYFIKKLSDKHDLERKDLMNRIMTRNYQEFVQGDVAYRQAEKVFTAEEIAALREEQGIPV